MARFPTSYFDDGLNDEQFEAKISNFTAANPNASFAGPLSFLNTHRYLLGESYLTGKGAATEFESGVAFWNRYSRILFDAEPE
ncbi:hypothetical protein D0860_02426 [Hortaea werneckii]|uniref:Uncharacterized protein n=1 Tax=Hortaea werneckii TaxID=91943 RepID=A0A3M7HKK3_HORWE|nr:hypothetical protein D0860_02426 [Hortaea werneckii]